ncbi:hypothetical protein B0A69_17905 [Chryseobacterium shigense]|uniref:Transglutaminase-like domain-containing protein n=1 Tax=Chryseobacterium shigense TaxID=297244 RepID=A0A1N7ICK9_9FLAO|nr:hypothetical protein [Chryseobacterium shigense]PQA91672.1 hypothetical protein B0A69_17905 [Chryseobacterium shigense]SIS34752.1 hypothetical protein SAMN05421639_10361 [Chryseobacterium shigense]
MKKIIILLILIFAGIFGRNFLFNSFFRYEIIKEREMYSLKNKHDVQYRNNGDVEDIINENLKETASALSFSFDPCASDPNILMETKKANCIGYSAFFAASLHNRLEEQGLDDDWSVSHEVGEIYFLNENINAYFKSKFFKDHDFVVVKNRKTKETIAVDPALYDYFRIDKIIVK